MMHTAKITLVLAGLLALARYVPIFYNSSEYSEFVKHEAARAQSVSGLKQSLMDHAKEYSLSINESDININRTDNMVRVTVDYKVPVSLIVYNHQLQFHAVGGGLLPAAR
jgi:hypothetical protein